MRPTSPARSRAGRLLLLTATNSWPVASSESLTKRSNLDSLRDVPTDAARARAEPGERLLEAAAKLAPVVGQRPLEPPAGGPQFGRDATRELRGLRRVGLAARAGDELGPGIRGADVDRGQLPDRLLHVLQAPD